MILDTCTELTMYHNNTGNHNKVWGWVNHNQIYWTFWGGLSKPWQFKRHDDQITPLLTLGYQKIKKGYMEKSPQEITQVDPTWTERFNQLFTAQVLMHS